MCRGALIIAESPGGGVGYEEKEKKNKYRNKTTKGGKMGSWCDTKT